MRKLSFAVVSAASLALAACGGNQDTVDNSEINAEATENLDALASDAANAAEAEALGNQAAQLNETANDTAVEPTDGLQANGAEADAAVNGM